MVLACPISVPDVKIIERSLYASVTELDKFVVNVVVVSVPVIAVPVYITPPEVEMFVLFGRADSLALFAFTT
jgi:hypothetical protein